jgi:pimeloyl-ACP methyl ester carboxylesterase
MKFYFKNAGVIVLLILLTLCSKTPSVKSGFAEINGTSLYYEVAGNGEPIVFIHGNFGDRRHWDFQFEPLSKQFKVIRYDVRGFGKSSLPKIDEPYSDTKDLKALLEFLGINKAHICGLSRGSSVAVDFAIEYPEMCLSLIPIGPWAGGYGFGNFQSPNADSLYAVFPVANKLLESHGAQAITDFIWKGNNCLAKSVKNPAIRDSLLKMGYNYSYWSHLNNSPIEGLNPPAISRLRDIHLPTLIITAEYDLESCKEIADIMEKEISGSKKVSINRTGHIMNMEKPEEFNKVISDFISDLE